MPETKFKICYKFFTQISAGPNSFRSMHIIRNKIPRLIRWVIFDASRHENHQYSSILSLFQRVDCGMFLDFISHGITAIASHLFPWRKVSGDATALGHGAEGPEERALASDAA